MSPPNFVCTNRLRPNDFALLPDTALNVMQRALALAREKNPKVLNLDLRQALKDQELDDDMIDKIFHAAEGYNAGQPISGTFYKLQCPQPAAAVEGASLPIRVDLDQATIAIRQQLDQTFAVVIEDSVNEIRINFSTNDEPRQIDYRAKSDDGYTAQGLSSAVAKTLAKALEDVLKKRSENISREAQDVIERRIAKLNNFTPKVVVYSR